jgi:class 3 adenylate cyclase/pimeloyl-ACP methyl ester carboxylesterase
MEPRIQYAQTSDGVSIAFWTLGAGPPLVEMQQTVFSHLRLELEGLPRRAWYERLAQTHTLVRFDPRGFGLSDHVTTDFSLDAFVRDIEAVVDRLALNEFDLFGLIDSGPVAVAYAVAHRERVSHLILWQTWARYVESRRILLPVLHLADSDWDLFIDTYAARLYGFVDASAARNVADVMRANLTPEIWRAINAAIEERDVSLLLPSVAAPTLILYREAAGSKEMTEATRFLGAQLQNAETAFLPGDLALPWRGDASEVGAAVDVIETFLGELPRSSASGTKQRVEEVTNPLPSGTAIILFADIVDSTALTERLGDTAFRDKARDLDAALRSAIREHSGTPIEGKLLGDGVLAVFASARQAIEAAIACGRSGDDAGLPLHLGLHAGDVIREENNVYGGAVNIASRISGVSAPGEVLVSQTVRDLARTSAGVSFEDRGNHVLKGVGDLQRLFAVKALG